MRSSVGKKDCPTPEFPNASLQFHLSKLNHALSERRKKHQFMDSRAVIGGADHGVEIADFDPVKAAWLRLFLIYGVSSLSISSDKTSP